jgi:hypothetical protein
MDCHHESRNGRQEWSLTSASNQEGKNETPEKYYSTIQNLKQPG